MKEKQNLKVKEPKREAGGLEAVASSAKHVFREVGVWDGTRALANINQFDGFDCPGCAWPDPDTERSAVEFCENGAKAVAEEATTAMCDPDFFARHSIDEMLQWTDYQIGKSGRAHDPPGRPAQLCAYQLGRCIYIHRRPLEEAFITARSNFLYLRSHQQ